MRDKRPAKARRLQTTLDAKSDVRTSATFSMATATTLFLLSESHGRLLTSPNKPCQGEDGLSL